MLYTLRFFSSKCSLFRNANLFGSCIIHILYTVCAKIKKKFRRQRVNMYQSLSGSDREEKKIQLPHRHSTLAIQGSQLTDLSCLSSFAYCKRQDSCTIHSSVH